MQARDPCSYFEQLFNNDAPMETNFSPFFASNASLGLTPRELREWRPNRTTNSNNDSDACPLGWRTLQLSPLVQAFLPAKIDPGNLTPALIKATKETVDAEEREKTEDTETTEELISEFQTSPFDMNTWDSTLSFSPNLNLNSTLQSRTHSKFQSTFQSIMEESEPESELESDSRPSPNSSWISQSTMSTMDLLFGSSESGDSEFMPHVSPWDPPKAHSKLWDTPKAQSKLWDTPKAHSKIWDTPKTYSKLWDTPKTHSKLWDTPKTHSKLWDTPTSNPKLWEPFEEANSTGKTA